MKPDLTYYHNSSFPLNILLFFPEKKKNSSELMNLKPKKHKNHIFLKNNFLYFGIYAD